MSLQVMETYCTKNDFWVEKQPGKLVITVRFGNRTQTCEAYTFLSGTDRKKVLKVSSKVGKFQNLKMDKFKDLLLDISNYVYVRPELDQSDGSLTIAGCTLDEAASENEISFLLYEVAWAADTFEKKFYKGKDAF